MKPKAPRSVQAASQNIGRTFIHSFAGLQVEVKIHDVKFSFGTVRYLVSAVSQPASNQVWIYAPEKPRWTDTKAG